MSRFSLPNDTFKSMLNQTQPSANVENGSGEQKLRISSLEEFPNHPFPVDDDDDMQQLCESIEQFGQKEPIIVRAKPGDRTRYQIISGHRRVYALRKLGIQYVRAFVEEMDDDDAIITMIDCNMKRSVILPSVKARVYKMRLDALKRKQGRPSGNGATKLHNFPQDKSRDELADMVGESHESIRRYIALNNLIPELLELVDVGLKNSIIKSGITRTKAVVLLLPFYGMKGSEVL